MAVEKHTADDTLVSTSRSTLLHKAIDALSSRERIRFHVKFSIKSSDIGKHGLTR